ncbi:hypothetical protein FGADI_2452 [Fusarium gaditjirri]|uniref:Uncharacterized protein n=1 Tax=Fusarium gaditjirri TaxID=282569 RepID=A0A8H4TI94_9HYPO|nr:hypothetical protein FGADI_2452 [Fusarium gaditjirri]
MKPYRDILPKPTPLEAEPEPEIDAAARTRGSQGASNQLPPVSVLVNTHELSEVNGQIDVLNTKVYHLKFMLQGREEAMQRCDPKKIKRAMEAFAYSRRPRYALLQAESTVKTLWRAITEAENDHARQTLYQLWGMSVQHQTR